jgi:mannosylglucosylglycerate synthase
MDITKLKVGILHSLIGKNDGVSIVIDQTIKTMVKKMQIPLGNIYCLAGHSPPRMNTTLDEVFWHRSEDNRYILEHYDKDAPENFEEFINSAVQYAKELIEDFIEENELDVFIVHNGCHPSNFVYAVATGMYFEERRKEGLMLPRYLLWWHDSHFERKRFAQCNDVIKKYLEFIPGAHVDGIVFINSTQPAYGRKYLEKFSKEDIDQFFERKTCIIPNTCDIPWKWKSLKEQSLPLIPPIDPYNRSFYKDVGLVDECEKRGFKVEDAIILLQHTRVVERKRIDVAVDFTIALYKRFLKDKKKKCLVLLVSGHSGDEHDTYRTWIEDYFQEKCKKDPLVAKNVILLFAEHLVLSNREVLASKKYYSFADIPGIVAASGGMGTYFSEVEGFGNNFLEMMALGLPVVVNRYDIYKTDLAPMGFDVAEVDECQISEEVIEKSYAYLTQAKVRAKAIEHNLNVLDHLLNHDIMANKLTPLIENLYKYR